MFFEVSFNNLVLFGYVSGYVVFVNVVVMVVVGIDENMFDLLGGEFVCIVDGCLIGFFCEMVQCIVVCVLQDLCFDMILEECDVELCCYVQFVGEEVL